MKEIEKIENQIYSYLNSGCETQSSKSHITELDIHEYDEEEIHQNAITRAKRQEKHKQFLKTLVVGDRVHTMDRNEMGNTGSEWEIREIIPEHNIFESECRGGIGEIILI